ncbi:MAG: biotin-dependent carboxyltransferase family protein [Ilumatobacteraceae bacterium]
MSAVVVESWGVGGSVRDAGRRGRAWLGASRGGAVDLASLELANRLVGNAPHGAAFESSGGLRIAARDRPVLVAMTGGVADVSGDVALGWGVPEVLPSGAVLRIGRLHEGTRVYVSVRGGLVATARPDTFAIGPDPAGPAASHPAVRRPGPDRILLWPGPRADWFAPDALDLLVTSEWTVTPHGDRIGVRLAGPMLRRAITRELPSEGLVEGAVQVPPDGQPIVMLADHPVTGGYPVIAVVDPAHIGHLAQTPPGRSVRFRPAVPNRSPTSGLAGEIVAPEPRSSGGGGGARG